MPHSTPELIRVGERNATADADVLGGKLLEQVAYDPVEAAQHQPEQHGARASQFMPECRRAPIPDGQHGHGCQFADGEERDEREWVHAGQIRFAAGNVHGSPKDAGTECSEHAQGGSPGRSPMRRGDGQQCGSSEHAGRTAENSEPALPSGVVQFVEEEIPRKLRESTRGAAGGRRDRTGRR